MYWRRIRKADLLKCFAFSPAALGDALVGEKEAHRAWNHLLCSPSFHGVVIERTNADKTSTIVGFGASVFVSELFASQQVRERKRGLNDRVISEFLARTGSVLSINQIAEDNASEGLNVVVLCGRWNRQGLSADDIVEAQMHLASSFIELHNGYRLRRMLTELRDTQDIEQARASRLWRITACHECDREAQDAVSFRPKNCFGLIETKDVRAVAGCILAPLFHGRLPLLNLRPSDQEFLLAALEGITDQELAHKLGLTLPAVKRRWEDIYERIKSCSVDLGPAFQNVPEQGRRGPQKRHHLLAYLRQHPEELRPFLRKPQVNATRSA